MTPLLLAELPAIITENKDLIIELIIGAIAGYIAEFLVPGRGYGLLVTILFGMVGGWLGGMLFHKLINFHTGVPYLNEVIRAVLGAMIVVILFNLITRGRGGNGNGNTRGGSEKDVYDWANE